MPVRRVLIAVAALALAAATGCSTYGHKIHVKQVPHRVYVTQAKKSVATWSRIAATPAWQDQLVILTEPLLVDVSDPTLSPALKLALRLNNVSVDAKVPDVAPSRGHVTFADGAIRDVGVISAKRAWSHLTPETCMPATCGAVITAAKLGAAQVRTNKGTATVPAWHFRVRGLSRDVVFLAVAGSDTKEPPQGADNPLITGLDTAQFVVSVDGDRITYAVDFEGGCFGEDKAEVYETDQVVALAGVTSAHDEVSGESCAGVGRTVPVTATLAKPVGDRVIIDGMTGRPLTYNTFGALEGT